jgi:hypothetical protein
MEEQKNLMGRVKGTAGDPVNQVTNSSMMSATRERASAVTNKARTVAFDQLHLVSREDLTRLEDSLLRIEAALADLAERLPERSPAKARAPRAKDLE